MTFYTLYNIVLGGISALASIIIGLNPPVGSIIQAGNRYLDNTNGTNTEYVGTLPVVDLKQSGLNYRTNGIQSGSVLYVDGINRGQKFYNSCTSTGGTNGVGGYYNTCGITQTATGSYRSISLECAKTRLSIANLSGGYLKTWTATASKTAGSAVFTTQPIPKFSANSTIGTGGILLYSGTGGKLVVPNETFVVQTDTVIPKTTGVDCKLFYDFVPTY